MNTLNGSAAETIPAFRNALTGEFRGSITENEPLAKHTTFQIGGPADLWVEPEDMASLQKVVDALARYHVPHFLIGEGSNLLVSDQGIRGVVIRLGGEFKNIDNRGNRLIAGAAVTIRELADRALQLGLGGMAPLCGIPGCLGGGIVMNAGAYGAALSDTLEWLETIELGGSPVRVMKTDITFAYRQARELQGKIVTRLCFQLIPGDKTVIQAEMDRVTKLRETHQPLEFPSAGSVFKRPPGDYAGRILEEVGAKGFRIGSAEVSTKHANFIVNRGNATAADVLSVIDELKARVRDAYGIELELEIRKVGFGSEEEKP